LIKKIQTQLIILYIWINILNIRRMVKHNSKSQQRQQFESGNNLETEGVGITWREEQISQTRIKGKSGELSSLLCLALCWSTRFQRAASYIWSSMTLDRLCGSPKMTVWQSLINLVSALTPYLIWASSRDVANPLNGVVTAFLPNLEHVCHDQSCHIRSYKVPYYHNLHIPSGTGHVNQKQWT
jgi:hypothetical protein